MSLRTGTSCAELAQTGTIVGPQFCAPHPIDLAFTTRAPWLKDNHVTVTDIHGKFILWSADGPTQGLGRKRMLHDADDNPLISMREKTLTAHERWGAFIGDSSEDRDLLFSVKKSSMFQTKSKFDVFLAGNKEEKVCDFKITGSYRKRRCTVYKGDSQMVLAQMSKKHEAINLPQGEGIFGVHINPNTDYCFIAALFAFLHAIHDDSDDEDFNIKDAIEIVAGTISQLAQLGN
ncbi:protein LURP-one-related 10 [Elaeis guineensis]|uniref:Protein LURP-one-related 10 n=1 Tax=Elaeis guineensis var. tenera TaxID=51953 RepID=A0A6I9RCF8_ELAGV|nr:protein LURP-one-related 10 [Elaeis guineensis]